MALVSRLEYLYDILDSGTPATVLLPWFPTPSMIKKLWAIHQVYKIVSRAVDARIRTGVRRNDTLQLLVDAEDNRSVIIGVSPLPT